MSGPVLGLALPGATAQPSAQDGWNPFKQAPDAGRAPARGARPSSRPARPWPSLPARSRRLGARSAGPSRAATLRQSWRPTPRACRSSFGAGSTSRRSRSCWPGSNCRRARRRCTGCGGACCCPRPRRRPARPTRALPRPAPGGPLSLRAAARHGGGAGRQRRRPARPDRCAARKDIGLGAREAGCQAIKSLAAPSSGLPGRLKGETQLLAGYCAAVAGDAHGRGPCRRARARGGHRGRAAAGRARRHREPGTKPQLALPKRVLLLDYRFLELLGPVDAAQVLDKAEPALLAVAGRRRQADARAADCRGRGGAAAQRAAARSSRRDLPPPAASRAARSRRPRGEHAIRCCGARLLFRAAEATQAPAAESAPHARRPRRCAHAPASICRRRACWRRCVADLWPSPEIGLVCGDERRDRAGRRRVRAGARRWAETAAEPAALAGADRHRRSGAARRAAAGRWRRWRSSPLRGRLDAERCIGWRPCSMRSTSTCRSACGRRRAARRNRGRLSAGDRRAGRPGASRASARTPAAPFCSPCARSGPNGADGANMLALGDSVRALKRAGLEADARRVGARGAVRRLAAHGRQLISAGMTRAAQRHIGRVSGDAGRRAGRSRQHAAGLSARPRRFPAPFSRTRADAARRRARPTSSAYLRASSEARPGAGLARAAAVRHPPAVQVPRRRRRDREDPALASPARRRHARCPRRFRWPRSTA